MIGDFIQACLDSVLKQLHEEGYVQKHVKTWSGYNKTTTIIARNMKMEAFHAENWRDGYKGTPPSPVLTASARLPPAWGPFSLVCVEIPQLHSDATKER